MFSASGRYHVTVKKHPPVIRKISTAKSGCPSSLTCMRTWNLRPFLWMYLLVLGCLIHGCALRRGSAGNRPKLSAAEARADVDALQATLRANHPSLYWYARPSLVDSGFALFRNSLTDSISQIRFRYGLSAAVALIRCGHTSVRFSPAYARYLEGYKGPVFPLQVAILHPDTMVFLAHLAGPDSLLRRGDQILSINGMSSRQLTRSFLPFVSNDGFSLPFRLQNISNAFGGMYRSVLGLDTAYQIVYLDSTGTERQRRLGNYVLRADTGRGKRQKLAGTPTGPQRPSRRKLRQQRRSSLLQLQIDSATRVAYMRVGSFSLAGSRGFYRRSFRKLRTAQTDKLIIDLRNNLGGNLSLSNLLLKYSSRRPFKIADSVYAVSRALRPGKYIHPKLFYRTSLWLRTRRMADGYYHLRHYEQKIYRPKKRNRYQGRLLVLQNGFSYSASTVYTHIMKGQEGVLIAGTESGGGGYGNSAIHLPTVVLPHSGLHVSLPLFRLVFHEGGPKGQGVLPHVELAPSAASIRLGQDKALLEARRLLSQP